MMVTWSDDESEDESDNRIVNIVTTLTEEINGEEESSEGEI